MEVVRTNEVGENKKASVRSSSPNVDYLSFQIAMCGLVGNKLVSVGDLKSM